MNDSLDIHETSSFSSKTLLIVMDNEVDDMHVIRRNHEE